MYRESAGIKLDFLFFIIIFFFLYNKSDNRIVLTVSRTISTSLSSYYKCFSKY